MLVFLFLGTLICAFARPIRRSIDVRWSSDDQYNCIDNHGIVRDRKFITNGQGRSMLGEYVMERNKDGNYERTLEVTMKNRYGGIMKKLKIFPNGCRMQIFRCNLTDEDICISGTIQKWKPGFWITEPIPFTCPVSNQTLPSNRKRKVKRSPTCFMERPVNNKSPTPCGIGEDSTLLSLEDISKNSVEYSDVPFDNEADLILSRGDGQYYWQDLPLQQMHVCKKHYTELGRGWKAKARRVERKRIKIGLQCMLDVNGARVHGKATLANPGTFLTKGESEALLFVKEKFVQPGIAVCKHHKDFVGDIVAEYRVIRKGYNLRQILPGPSLAESPATPHALPAFLQHQQEGVCPTIDEDYDPRKSQSSVLILESLRQSILDVAREDDIDPAAVHFSNNFHGLAPSTKRKRINTARKLAFSICKAFAPDDPKYFEQLLNGRQTLDFAQADIQAKLNNVVKVVLECFQNATTPTVKQQALSMIAPFFGLPEIQAYFPDVSPYYFKKARLFAKQYGAGQQQLPRPDTRRQRVTDKQLEVVIQFITSPPIIVDLPFGIATAKKSDGTKEDIPLVVRIQVNERIYRQYIAYLQESNQQDLAVSRSTMLRILNFCTATTRRSLEGLDYFTFAGGEGFNTLMEITQQLSQYSEDHEWASIITYQLKEARQYLKLDYKLHVKVASRIPDHCMSYALSDAEKPYFAITLTHQADLKCDRCESLNSAITEVKHQLEATVFPTDYEKLETVYEFDKAVNDIFEMKKHILRTIRQDQARIDTLERLDRNSIFVVVDWAMKHLPVAGRVPQNEWFGQRGTSWHISHVTARDESGTGYRTRVYVHVFESVAQDSPAVIGILNSLLRQVKKELPQITRAYLRSDNAGCYKSSQTIAAMPEVSANSGITIKRWDFSDPQSGKGACDRAAATIKRHVRLYAAENNRCTNAREFAICANSYSGIKSVTVMLAEMTTEKRMQPKISGITSYNNFEFRNLDRPDQADIVVWQAYKIGSGFTLPRASWRNKQLLRELKIVATFTEGSEADVVDSRYWKNTLSPPSEPDGQINEIGDYEESEEGLVEKLLYPCPEANCVKVYQSLRSLNSHLDSGTHRYQPEKVSLQDAAIGAYKKELEGLRLPAQLPVVNNVLQNIVQGAAGVPLLSKGWALRSKRACTTFTSAQRDFLSTKFQQGAKTGRKLDPKIISKQMRRNFPKEEWLTWNQIASYWSRLAQIQRKEQAGATECREEDEIGDEEEQGINVSDENIADDPYFNTPADDIIDAIDQNQRDIFE